jgi:hypothetical protein
MPAAGSGRFFASPGFGTAFTSVSAYSRVAVTGSFVRHWCASVITVSVPANRIQNTRYRYAGMNGTTHQPRHSRRALGYTTNSALVVHVAASITKYAP